MMAGVVIRERNVGDVEAGILDSFSSSHGDCFEAGFGSAYIRNLRFSKCFLILFRKSA